MFKQFLLAGALIAVPVALFAGAEHFLMPTTAAEAAATAPLGDVSAMQAIVSDVQSIAKGGDLVAAEKRITDFETAWDEAEPTLRPMNKDAWSAVDEAADKALKALRAKTPDAGQVSAALDTLAAKLADPLGA